MLQFYVQSQMQTSTSFVVYLVLWLFSVESMAKKEPVNISTAFDRQTFVLTSCLLVEKYQTSSLLSECFDQKTTSLFVNMLPKAYTLLSEMYHSINSIMSTLKNEWSENDYEIPVETLVAFESIICMWTIFNRILAQVKGRRRRKKSPKRNEIHFDKKTKAMFITESRCL